MVGGSQDEKKPLLVEVNPRSLLLSSIGNDTQDYNVICASAKFIIVHYIGDCCCVKTTIL